MNPKSPKKSKTTTAKQRERKNHKFIIGYEEKGIKGRGKEEHTLKISSAIGEQLNRRKIQRILLKQGRNDCKSKWRREKELKAND